MIPEIEQQSNAIAAAAAAAALLFGKYEVGKLLGCGAFAKVYHAREASTGRSVALKVISKKKLLSSNANLANNVKREVSIMKRLRHRNIVALHEVAATKSKIYFVMDFVKGGELFAKVAKGRFSEDLARRYFRQLVSAVGYCHSRGVFHRDLKPENLLIDDRGNLKVSDFGLSAVAVDQTRCDGLLHTLCGTPAYVAPEILAKKGYDGARVDVWSCGVVLFVLTAGYLPFNDPNLMAMYKKIYKGEYRCPKWMSPELKRFLSRLLETNPDKRITVDEIVNDPWFSHGGFDAAKEFYCEDEEDEEEEEKEDVAAAVAAVADEEENSGSLNAFHIISFSSGLDLSGLFSGNSAEDRERFLSGEEPGAVVERIEGFAREEGVRVRRRKGMGVEMEGLNGNFSARVDFYRVNEELVVVEAKRKGGDSGVYKAMWRSKLRTVLEGDSGEVSGNSTSSSSDL